MNTEHFNNTVPTRTTASTVSNNTNHFRPGQLLVIITTYVSKLN